MASIDDILNVQNQKLLKGVYSEVLAKADQIVKKHVQSEQSLGKQVGLLDLHLKKYEAVQSALAEVEKLTSDIHKEQLAEYEALEAQHKAAQNELKRQEALQASIVKRQKEGDELRKEEAKIRRELNRDLKKAGEEQLGQIKFEKKYNYNKKLARDQAIRDKKKEIKKIEEAMELNREGQQEALDELETQRKIVALYARKIGVAKKVGDSVENILNKMDFVTKESEQTLANMMKLTVEGMKFGDLIGDALKDVGISALTGMLDSLIQKMVLSTARVVPLFSQLTAQVSSATGQMGEYNDLIIETRYNQHDLAVSYEESAEAITTLFDTMESFSHMTDKQRRNVTELSTQMLRMGAQTQTTADAMVIIERSLGMGAEATQNLTKNLRGMADVLKVSTERVLSDFNSAMETLSVYGERGIETFAGLEAQSKATNIAMSDLLGIASQFDTFESAATAAGKLNAAMGGGYVDSLELMMMKEDERIVKIKETMDLNKRRWEDMGKFEKRFYMQTLGIENANTANKLFNSSTEEMKERMELAQRAADELGGSWEDYVDKSEEAVSLQMRTNQIFRDFAVVVKPLADFLGGILGLVAKVTKAFGDWGAALAVPLMGALTGVGIYLKNRFMPLISDQAKVMQHLAKNIKAGNAATAVSNGLQGQSAVANMASAKAASANAAATKSLAIGIAAIAASIAMVIASVALLVSQLNESKDLWGVVGGAAAIMGAAFLGLSLTIKFALVPAIVALGGAAGIASGPLMALSLPILAIGASISAIILSASLLVSTIGTMLTAAMEAKPALVELSGALLSLGAASVALSLTGWTAGLALGAFSVGMMALAGSLAMIKTDDLMAIATIFENIGDGNISKFAMAAGSLVAMAESIDGSFYGIGSAINSIGEQITNQSLSRVTMFAQALSRIAVVDFGIVNSGIRSLSSAVSGVSNASARVTVESAAPGAPGASSGGILSGFNAGAASSVINRTNERRTTSSSSTEEVIRTIVKEVVTATRGPGAPKSVRPIIIELDGRELGRFIENEFELGEEKRSGKVRLS